MDTPVDQILTVLERIAAALERIASRLDLPDGTSALPMKVEQVIENVERAFSFPAAAPAEAVLAPAPNPLIDFLSKRKVSIKTFPKRDEGDEILDRLAQYIGSRYSSVRKLLEAVKRNLSNGDSFCLNLRTDRQEDVSSICQLASQLHEVAFLTRYRYEKSPKCLLWAQPSRFPKAINFFTGGWLERYIRSQVLSALNWSRPGQKVSYLSGIQVILPNGDDFELDLLVAAEQDVFWFEAKTGDYQQFVQKYAKISNLLGLTPQRSVMVLTDVSRTTASAIAGLFKMTVIPISDVDELLEQLFGLPAASESNGAEPGAGPDGGA